MFSIFIWCFNHQLWWFKLNKWLFFPFILLPAIVRNTLWQMLFLECSSNPPKTITSIVWLQFIHYWILAEIYMDFRSVRLQVASRHWTSLGPSINLGPFTIRQTSKELALTCLDAWMPGWLMRFSLPKMVWCMSNTGIYLQHPPNMAISQGKWWSIRIYIIQIHFDKGYIPCWSLRAHSSFSPQQQVTG